MYMEPRDQKRSLPPNFSERLWFEIEEKKPFKVLLQKKNHSAAVGEYLKQRGIQ